jgi:hypothetical protein
MELHPMEVELLQRIRNKYRFGEIVIECRDGLPFRIGRTTVYEALFDSKDK